MKLVSIFYLALMSIITYSSFSNSIIINEVSSKNETSILDEDNEKSDWIELFNNADYPINLKDYRIYDKDSFDNAWILPDTVINPKDNLLIFASSKSRNTSNKWGIDASGFGITTFTAFDGMHYEYINYEGDFEISLAVHTFFLSNHFSYIGINFRENLNAESRYAGMFFVPNELNTARLMYRNIENSNPESMDFTQEVIYPISKIKLKRIGNKFVFCISDSDGFDIECKEIEMDMPKSGYLGISYSSQNQNTLSKVIISDLVLNNKPYDFSNLQGIDFNCDIPGKLYLNNEIHTNFDIKTSGETIYLWNNKGILEDKVKIPALKADVSYGRYPDGSNNLMYFYPPTPRLTNNHQYDKYLADVEADKLGGFYDNNIAISLSNSDKDAKIYYTLDGSIPNIDNGILYNNTPILIDSTTVLRAIATKNGCLQSDPRTYTYFINTEFRLPVISVVADPYDLYDSTNGLLTERNLYSTEELKGNFEFWNEKSQSPNLNLRDGIKRHGHGAALSERPSIRVYARDEYENSDFSFNYFGDRNLKKYKRLVIRNSGQDWQYNYFRDALSGILANNLGTMVTSAYKPISLYINGKYQGLFNLREHMSTKTLGIKYNIPEESINFIDELFYIKDGSSRTFWELYNYIDTNDINSISAYHEIDKRLDIMNTIDYYSTEMIFNNFDWGDNNNKFWMSSALDSKWRFILWDLDWTLGRPNSEANSNKIYDIFRLAKEEKETHKIFALFDKLLTNDSIKVQFLNRINDLLNYYYTSDRIGNTTDSLVNLINIELPYHTDINPTSCQFFDEGIVRIKSYSKERPNFLRNALKDILNLDTMGTVYLSSNNSIAGKIKISTITPDSLPWSGIYYTKIPIKIEAISNNGYKFIKWEGDINSYDKEITIQLDSNINLKAIFENNDYVEPKLNLIINEIMYKPSSNNDCGDWFELYNPSKTDTINLKGYYFKDSEDERYFTIPEYLLAPNEYVVLCENLDLFKVIYPNITNIIGSFDFGLGKSDEVRIYDRYWNLIDSVSYTNISPWPTNADATGSSIELIDYNLDNNIGDNWLASTFLGTPGAINSTLISVKDNNLIGSINIYPNPSNNILTYELNSSYLISNLEIKDINGEVKLLISNIQNYGSIDISRLVAGTYFITINTTSGQLVSKFIKLK